MKKSTLKLLLLMAVMLLSHTLWADVTFKFKAPSNWSKCYLWAWDDNQKQLASSTSTWPGDAAMTLGSDGYYIYTLKTSVSKVNFLFNNGASSGTKQTVDDYTTASKFMGRYGSTDSQGHYNITEETYVDSGDEGGSGDSGDDNDDVVTPDQTSEVTIAAIRSRLSINTKDFKDFAGLYVSALPKAGDATVSYEWQFSSDGTSWAKYSAGDGATWDNIRPNTAGYYRCVLSYDLAGAVTTYTSNTLQITHNGGSQVSFSSKLPVILVRTAKDFPTAGYLDNDGVAALKAKRSVDVKILWNEEGSNVTNSDINNKDMLHYDRKARMNYRGSSSLRNPKKSYAFVTGDKNCDSKKLGEVKTKKFGMFGAEAQKDWVLYASYPDATYMRNILTYHQYSQMTGLWGAKCRYVELYIDGSYEGVYVFMDKITQDENRVNVNEDTGFIVKFDKTDEVDSYDAYKGGNEDYKRNTFVTSNTGKRHISTYEQYVDQAFEIEYPEREDLAEFDDDGNLVDDSAWDAKVSGVKSRFEEMEQAILANDYAKLATIIDYDSWADYFIMNEFSRNADAYRISCVFTLNSLEDKIVANPMWDYELGWGNQDTYTSGLMVEDNTYYSDDFPTPFWWIGKGKSGCNGILGDCKFRAKVLERWQKHIGTNGALNSTVLNAKIDSLKAVLSGGSEKLSVSTNSLKSWVTSRTSGLNSELNTWDACPDLKFALVGTINGSTITSYANGVPFTMQADGSYTATFTATDTSHSLQVITSTGDIWARDNSKNIVSTDEDVSSYASMTSGQKTGYANITTVANTEYSFTFKLNGDGVSGKLTYAKGSTETPDNPDDPDDPDKPITYTELYLKGAITSWGDDENFRLNTTDGDYYVVSYPAGEEVEISGEFKLASTDWSTYNFGAASGTPAIEAGKEYVLAVTNTNLVASGIIKVSKIEFTVSTKKLKITGVEKVYDVEISAIRDRYSINPRDFKDFAGLYVSKLPKAGDATVSYEWQFASSGSNWVTYSAGDGATWDNIRPNKIGYYRCVLTYDLAGEVTTYTSNSISITDNGGAAVTFSSKLPVILVRTAKDFPVHNIDTQGYPNIEQVEALKAKRSVDVKILWNEEGGSVTNADINNADMLHYDRKARMNYRGSSSLYNSKKSYAFVSGDKNCDPKKLGEVKTKKFGMFGAAAQKDWVLYASAPDNTYMRNILTYHQYSQMTGLWGAKCRYVELYIDGSYQGIYVFMDKITQDENRVNVNEDTGYIVKFDKTDIADRYLGKEGANEDYKRNTFTTSYTGRTGISTYNITVDQAFEIEYPEREDLAEFDDDGNLVDDSAWDAKVAGVKNRFEEMERAILANDYAKLATIIDYESWADYFIMNEFTKNADAYRISCVFTLNSLEDKIVANPMWDYELGWGNENTNTSGLLVEENRYYSDSFPTPFWWTGKGKSGCNGILGDCKFRAIVKERWAKHIGIDGALNSTVLNAKIDSLQAALSGSSTKTSVSTTPLKNWISDRTPALNSVISAWETCPVPEITDLVAPVFAQIYVGETTTSTATFSVANASDVEIELAGDAFSLVSKTESSVEIAFAPSAAGTFNGTLTITADEVVTETINFSATAILKPAISDLVAPVFAQIYVGETATGVATFSVANASDVEIELSGEAFSLVSKTESSVEIAFAPIAAGTFNGTLTITADGIVTETISFSASAILKPVISDLVAPVFAQIYVGESATGTATFSVANASDVEVEVTGDAFSLVSKTDGSAEIEFAPIAAGTFNGTLTITADGIVTETIEFSASAILKPEITDLVAPVFTQIYVGETTTSTATFSVENATDVEVELTGDAFSILSKSESSVEIAFAPSAAGTFNGTLTITADGIVTETISFSATAILKPAITDIVSPVFTEIYVGETATGVATFSVANASDVEVELSGDDAFIILSESDGSVEIAFAPIAAGTFNGTLTITADEVVTEIISFSATAILKPAITDIVSPVFTEIYVGQTATGVATFSVANASDVEIELAGDAFSLVSKTESSVEIAFAPIAAGTFNGTLTITADEVVTETISFSAVAILKPAITDIVAPVFTEIYVGETATATATFSVANASDVEIELSGDDAFIILSESEGSVEIAFAPSAAGTFNGTLTITADEVVTETISFSAVAILKPAITDIVAPVFAQIYVGESATGVATFSVENATDVEVELTGDAFSILSEVDGSVEIVFTPTTAGTFNGVLTITADGVVTETISFSATAILKPVITDIVSPVFTEIYVGETATATATFSVANASDVEVELSGDDAFIILSESDGSVEIAFAPIAAGTFNGTLTITADGIVTETISFSASAIESVTTSIDECNELNIYAKEGTIYCDEEFTIYNLAGVDVTSLNGSLQGVYLVVTANGNKQVSVW